MKRRARIALVGALTLGLAAPAAAGGGDNIARALNDKDNTRVNDVKFDIATQSGGAVDNLNQAEAYAKCTGCGAAAAAFQIVLASGNVSSVTPTNVSVAVNDQCTNCKVDAAAYQWVYVTSEPMKLSEGGKEVFSDVKENVKQLVKSGLTGPELRSELDAQAARVKEALGRYLVATDGKRDRRPDRMTYRTARKSRG